MDPASEDNPDVSPYVYCSDNPINMVDDDGREGHWEIDPSDPEQKRKVWVLDPVYAKTNNNKFVEALADAFVVGAELDPDPSTKLILVGAAAITAGIVYYNSQANSTPAYTYPQQNDFTPPYQFNEEHKELTNKEGKIAEKLGISKKAVKDAIHAAKRKYLNGGSTKGGERNPDVEVDLNTGEIYPKYQDGHLGDSIGNIFDHSK